MAAITGSIVWLQKAWRAWRDHELQIVIDEAAEDRRREQLHHPRNVWFWYLPPPC